MRFFHGLLFFGRGEQSSREAAFLRERFETALELASGAQQGETSLKEEIELRDSVDDIVAALLGVLLIRGHKLRYPPMPVPIPVDFKPALVLRQRDDLEMIEQCGLTLDCTFLLQVAQLKRKADKYDKLSTEEHIDFAKYGIKSTDDLAAMADKARRYDDILNQITEALNRKEPSSMSCLISVGGSKSTSDGGATFVINPDDRASFNGEG